MLRPSVRGLFGQQSAQLLLSATAAAGLAVLLSLVLHGVHHLQEGHGLTLSGLAGLDQRGLHVGSRARAASAVQSGQGSLLLERARGLLAHQLALGSRAQSGLLALPVALGLLAHGRAHGVGRSARSAALGRGAHGLALGAVGGLAQILRAAHVALGLVAVDLAGGARSLLAMNLALGALAHWVALGRARGVITLPSALWVACAVVAAIGLQLELGLQL